MNVFPKIPIFFSLLQSQNSQLWPHLHSIVFALGPKQGIKIHLMNEKYFQSLSVVTTMPYTFPPPLSLSWVLDPDMSSSVVQRHLVQEAGWRQAWRRVTEPGTTLDKQGTLDARTWRPAGFLNCLSVLVQFSCCRLWSYSCLQDTNIYLAITTVQIQ